MNVDTRVAGFGPLSPWILTVNPEPWWARYVPQLWLVPLVLAGAGWLSRQRGLQVGALVLVLICAFDAGKSGVYILHAQMEQSRQVKDQLDALEGQRLEVNLHSFASVTAHLPERRIPYRIQQKAGCTQPVPIAMTSAVYCIGKY